MNGCVAAGGPTGSHLEQLGVVGIADVNASSGNTRALNLRVTTQAKIGVALDEHFPIDRAVWIMTGGAAFAQGFMLEDKGPCLFAMTLGTTFVLPGHGQSACRFKDVAAMRVMALHATHVSFDDRVMLGQVEFGLNVEMTLKAGGWVLAGIDDEFSAAAGFNVFATGAVAGLTAGFTDHGRVFKMDPCVGAGRKLPDDFRVAIQAGLVAHVMSAGNFKRRDHHRRGGGA